MLNPSKEIEEKGTGVFAEQAERKELGDRRDSNPLKRGPIISEIMACFRGYQRHNGSEVMDG